MITQSGSQGRKLVRGYADEFGDRGCSEKASRFFGFAGVLTADEDDDLLRDAVDQVRTDLKTPNPLTWKRHMKVYPRRQCATDTLVALPGVTVVYVLVEKAAIPPGSGMLTDQVLFFNFAAGLLLERMLLAAKYWPGGSRDLLMRFGIVKGHDHSTTQSYFAHRRANDPSWVPWYLLRGGTAHFEGQAAWDGLQAADAYAGMLHTAIRPNEYGGWEEHHFLKMRPQLRRGPGGQAERYGFKFLGGATTLTSMPWWPTGGL